MQFKVLPYHLVRQVGGVHLGAPLAALEAVGARRRVFEEHVLVRRGEVRFTRSSANSPKVTKTIGGCSLSTFRTASVNWPGRVPGTRVALAHGQIGEKQHALVDPALQADLGAVGRHLGEVDIVVVDSS